MARRHPGTVSLLLVLAVFCACAKTVQKEDPTGPTDKALPYSLGHGWRAAIDADPKLLEQGSDGWVLFWRNDWVGSLAPAVGDDSDGLAARRARACLALASFLRTAGHLHRSLVAETGEYRLSAAGRIEVGAATPLFLGWALARLGKTDRAKAVLGPVLAAGGQSADRARKILEGAAAGTVVRIPWATDSVKKGDGAVTVAPLVAAAAPLAEETVRERGNEGILRHFDPDLLEAAAIAACGEAADAIGDRKGPFLFLSCEVEACEGSTALNACRAASAFAGPVPWPILRYGTAETEDDLRGLASARTGTPRSDAGAMAVFEAVLAPQTARTRDLLRARRDEVRQHVAQMRQSWTGPGAAELVRMGAAERQGVAVATAAARALWRMGEPLHASLPALECLYDPGRSDTVDARHDPEYLMMLAAAYIDANRFPEGLQILRALERDFPVLAMVREAAETVSIQRTLDTRGTVRRE